MTIASAPTAAPNASPSPGALASLNNGEATPNQGSSLPSTFLTVLTHLTDALAPGNDVEPAPTGKRNGKDDKKDSVAALFGPGQMATQNDVFAGLTLQFQVFQSTPGANGTASNGKSANAASLEALPPTAGTEPDPTAIAGNTTKSKGSPAPPPQQSVTMGMNLDFRQFLFDPPVDTGRHADDKTASTGNTRPAASETSPAAPLAFAVKLTENATKDLQPASFHTVAAALNDTPVKTPQLRDAVASQKPASVVYTSQTQSGADKPQPTTRDTPAVVGAAEQDSQSNSETPTTDDQSSAPLGNHRDQTRVQSQTNAVPSVDRNAITDRQTQQAQQQQQDKGESQQKEPPEKSAQTKEQQQVHSSEPESQAPSAANTGSTRDDARLNASPTTANIGGPQAVRTEAASAPGRAATSDASNKASSAEITETNSPVHLPSTREISMRIATPDSPNVDIKLVDRAGSVRVAVRTDDTDLARNLQGGLSDLVQKLEKQGFEAEPWSPDRSAGITMQPSQGSASGSNHQQQGSRDPRDASQQGHSGQQNGGRNRPRWVAELEEKFATTETEIS